MRRSRVQDTALVLMGLLTAMLVWGLARPVLLPDGSLTTAQHYLLQMAQEAVFFGLPALLLRPWWSHGIHRSRHWRQGCVIGLAAGAALAVVMTPVCAAWSALMRVTPQAQPMPVTALEWLLGVLAMVVVPAVAEEAFFRGGVLCGLARGLGGKAAFALTAAAFTLMHGRLAALPAHLACGCLFTLGMARYGKLWPSIAMHLAYNAGMLALPALGAAPAAAAALVLIAAALPMLRKTVWCERKPLDVTDGSLGVMALAMLVFYFVVQLQ